jgi:KipI family sensor histidine kinase inhibitor
LLLAIEEEKIEGIIDFIPSYNELMICFDPLVADYNCLLEKLRGTENYYSTIKLPEASVINIPVLYGGDCGPDIDEVARLNNLSPEEVILIHSSVTYLVYMLGFTPGFCYLGGLDDRISAPRKKNPGLNIPAGSVGIAGNQTGIYPIDSPGGWQIIGRTPVKLFDPERKPEFLFSAGDYVRFFPVGRDQFNAVFRDVKNGKFKLKITAKDN